MGGSAADTIRQARDPVNPSGPQESPHRAGRRTQDPSDHAKPILYNYLVYTYGRLAEENKITAAPDGNHAVFNTGLVTINQEPIFALFMCRSRRTLRGGA
jgi:Domain of unknown function (DUF3825)